MSDLRRVILTAHIYEGLLRGSEPEVVLDAILDDPHIAVLEQTEYQKLIDRITELENKIDDMEMSEEARNDW